jgi:hypothetical protein
MKNVLKIGLAIFSLLSLHGDDLPKEPPQEVVKPIPTPPPEAPWFTGPLLAPPGTVTPFGSYEIEPYIYFTTTTGIYNKDWKIVNSSHNFFSLNPELFLYFGLTSWLDINIITQFFYNTVSNQNSVNFGDLQIGLDFQLLEPGFTPYFPGIKLTVRETFPTGPYEKLHPKKLLTDLSGAGTYGSTFNLVFYDVYHLWKNHFLTTTYSAAYTVTTPVKVHGFNAYGGGFNANGTALPGNTFQAIISFELSLSQNFGLALDNVYTHVNKTKFFGSPGTTTTGAISSNSLPSSEQLSFAPAIEYNFNSTTGIAIGAWVTALGRNSPIFNSAIIDLVLVF